jgi:hypothetical protein
VPDIAFARNGRAVFPTKYHGDVTLSKGKWDRICGEPERLYYRFNGEKIATTLINPDQVRSHQREPNQFFYYKKYSKLSMDGTVEITLGLGVYFAVVIDAEAGRICTVYPVETPKPGKAFSPKAKQ